LGYTVFISHSTKDRFIAQQVAGLIQEAGGGLGIETFLDERDIEFGGSIPERVSREIRDCGELVVLLSESSVDRPWVLIEIGAAWVLEKRIVAVMDKLSPDQVPDVIAPYRAVDLNEVQDYIDELVGRPGTPRMEERLDAEAGKDGHSPDFCQLLFRRPMVRYAVARSAGKPPRRQCLRNAGPERSRRLPTAP
jgi:hypothetical protein